MACAALVSLTQTIEKITLSTHQYSISVLHQHEIRFLYDRVIYLQELADSFPEEADYFQWPIEEVANEALDVIEQIISERIRSRFNIKRLLSKFVKRKKELADGFPEEAHDFECGIRSVANEVEDVIEQLISERIRSRFNIKLLLTKFVKRKTSFHQQLQKVSRKIDSTIVDLEERAKRLQLSASPATVSPSVPTLTSKSKNMVGLGDDLIAIKSRLCGGSPKLQVVPILGMGGIGKTTLARNVYNDPLTIQYFDVRAWVTVSQDYCTQKIAASIVNSMKEFITKKFEQPDEETVYKGLKGRRYLIVMDDMWSTDAWDDIRNLFPNDDNGSRIMLTTRLSDVAAYPDYQTSPHEMRFMGIEQSWELLRQRVFADKYCCCLELEYIGMKIAESCRGLPLAIMVIAGLLSTVEENRASWSKIAENVSSIVATEDGEFDKILSLSYANLPHHLRPCFLYMGGFPEDHDIHASELVKLWVAEGFLSCSEASSSSKSLEDVGEECLEDLVNRSLVLVTERKHNGRIKSCSLHDMIRDSCIRKSQENNFFLNLMDRFVEKRRFIESIQDQNRISVRYSSLRYLSRTYCSTMHTIMCFPTTNREKNRPIKLNFLKNVESLRVLDAETLGVESLPGQLFELFHLRYLAVRCFMIPAAISRLQNLQTLILDAREQRKFIGRPIVGCLPQEIWMMPRLRHLICHSKLPNPNETASSTLENLQTLSIVLNDMCFEGILEKIPNIKKLGIDCSSYDYGTYLNNLAYLHQLESLKLCNGNWRKDSISFPRVLKKLTLCNMVLPWSEMSVVGSLPSLEVLKLRDFACVGSTWETSEGEFPELQFLLIETCRFEHWISESNHFPKLKFLLLHECWFLNEIPEGLGESTTLEVIDVRGHARPVPKSLAESAKRIQEEQQSYGNDAFQVHCPLPESCDTNDWLFDQYNKLNKDREEVGTSNLEEGDLSDYTEVERMFDDCMIMYR